MKLSSTLVAIGMLQVALAQSIAPSPTESIGCEPHGDHWCVLTSVPYLRAWDKGLLLSLTGTARDPVPPMMLPPRTVLGVMTVTAPSTRLPLRTQARRPPSPLAANLTATTGIVRVLLRPTVPRTMPTPRRTPARLPPSRSDVSPTGTIGTAMAPPRREPRRMVPRSLSPPTALLARSGSALAPSPPSPHLP